MNDIRYDLDGLQQCANQMNICLPNLLERQHWAEIEWQISIPKNIWNGEAAEKYRLLCKKIVAEQDATSVRKLPYLIRGVIVRIREREQASANAVERAFN